MKRVDSEKRKKLLRSLSAGELVPYEGESNQPERTDEETRVTNNNDNNQHANVENKPSLVRKNVLVKRNTKIGPKLFIETIPASLLQTLTPLEVKRQELLLELYNSEKNYVEDLKLLVEVCILKSIFE
jgi:hypothetical protein